MSIQEFRKKVKLKKYSIDLTKSLSFLSQPQTTLNKSNYAVLKNSNLGPEKSAYCNGYIENSILVRELRKIFWAIEFYFKMRIWAYI